MQKPLGLSNAGLEDGIVQVFGFVCLFVFERGTKFLKNKSEK